MTTATSSNSLAGRYTHLCANGRDTVLQRARECAKLTLPTMYPPLGATQTVAFETPWQSLGARAVNNLAAKLLLTLFPPNTPFFRLVIDELSLRKLTGQTGLRGDIEKALSSMERSVMNEVETTAARPGLNECFKHLLISGNALLHVQPDNSLRVFSLSNYAVKRDPSGNVLELVVKECVSRLELPPALQGLVQSSSPASKDAAVDNVDLYTGIRWNGTAYDVRQEVNTVPVPGSKGTYPKDKMPFLALRWIAVDGEDYGRGMVEQYMGDLKSLEGLQQAIVEGAVSAARVVFLVRPNSTTKKDVIANTASGGVASGHKDDVSVLQVEKFADFKFAQETRSEIIQALSFAFMLNTAIQRNGERVTAEEIRYMANELESSLGGVYSTLAQSLQLPFVTIVMSRMEQQKRLPQLPKGFIKPAVTTGVAALGRGNDLNRMQQFFQSFAGLPPEVVQQVFAYVNSSELIKRNAAAAQIEPDGLIKTDQQVQQERQQAAMMQAAQTAVPHVAKGAMDMAAQQQGAK